MFIIFMFAKRYILITDSNHLIIGSWLKIVIIVLVMKY